MARSRLPFVVSVLSLAVVVLAACGDEDDPVTATGAGGGGIETTTSIRTTEPGTFEPSRDGTMLRWFETAGECQVCGFSITFDASGTATYEGDDEESTIAFDAAELAQRMVALDRQSLVVGTDDCGREVDGNAPVLELTSVDGSVTVIDDCFDTIDRDHPMMQFVTTALDDARTAAATG